MPSQENKTKTPAKGLVLIALVFMLLGTATELYLLHHFEGVQQLIPLFCIGAATLCLVLHLILKANLFRLLLKLGLVCTALSGVYGTFLHLKANMEFEQEMHPTVSGWNLFTESLAGALPSLAPCSLIVLALIGFAYLKLLTHKA